MYEAKKVMKNVQDDDYKDMATLPHFQPRSMDIDQTAMYSEGSPPIKVKSNAQNREEKANRTHTLK
ncbi:hypothetical protein BGX23_001150 [Mortierella sp. AD031]|nr:hypothetical protein BGX23_001150 [Mortierella sp. AD031]